MNEFQIIVFSATAPILGTAGICLAGALYYSARDLVRRIMQFESFRR